MVQSRPRNAGGRASQVPRFCLYSYEAEGPATTQPRVCQSAAVLLYHGGDDVVTTRP